jgi:hypothetical protein
MGTSHFDTASTWADRIKRDHKYDWAKQLHYIDSECDVGVTVRPQTSFLGLRIANAILPTRPSLPAASKSPAAHASKSPAASPDENNIITAILNITNDLKYNKRYLDKTTIGENVKFLLHFLQDFNQPMHLLGYARGGNDFSLYLEMPDGTVKRTNVHTLWDSFIPEYYLDNYKYNFTRVISYNITDMNSYWEFLHKYYNDNLEFACKYKVTSHKLVFSEYFKADMMQYLFDTYLSLALGTFYFIYSLD